MQLKRSTLFCALFSAFITAPVSALEIYNNKDNTLSIGGYIALAEMYTEDKPNLNGGFSTIIDNDSRLNFNVTHQFNDIWNSGAKIEWGYDSVSGNEQDLTNRIGKIYFNSDLYGDIAIGKQWSPYYDIAGWTDIFYLNGGSASGAYDGRNDPAEDGGEGGTGRADDALTYRHDIMGFKVGLQYQADQGHNVGDRTNGYQIALIYDSMDLFDLGISGGLTYNKVQYEQQNNGEAWLFGLMYNANNIYAAATYGKYENYSTINDGIPEKINLNGEISDNPAYNNGVAHKADGYELALTYTLQDYTLYGGYNHLNDKNSPAQYSYFILGASWIHDTLTFALEMNLDNKTVSQQGENSGQNTYGITAQYDF